MAPSADWAQFVETTDRKNLERQLLHAQKMEVVGRLAGSIAHDFNNLLTAISAFAQFASEGVTADHPSHGDIGQILLATERGSALTRRLLAFSRQQVLNPAPSTSIASSPASTACYSVCSVKT